MTDAAGEEWSTVPTPRVETTESRASGDLGAALRTFRLRWGIAFAVIGLSFIATIVILNATVFSAKGFADAYLDSLSRHDIATALATPGVEIPEDAAGDLLSADALGAMRVVRLTDDRADARGHHTLTYEVELDGTRTETVLTVAPAGTSFAVFPSWRFDVSPVAVLEVTPQSGRDFVANGVTATAEKGVGAASAFSSLVPAAYAIGQDAELYTADRRQTVVAVPGVRAQARIEATATADFVDLVQNQLDGLLDECVTQTVLQPTGCPFGQTIRDRIVTPPAWSMTTYPQISIVPGTTPGTWLVPRVAGAAHVVVDVRSLFDGTVTTLDQDVPFEVGYLITVDDAGNVSIAAQ